MRILVKIRQFYWLSVGCISVMSATFLLMPLVSNPEVDKGIMFYMVGILFWISLISGYLFLVMANRLRKLYVTYKLEQDVSMGCKAGIVTFFANPPGKIADIVLFISVFLAVMVFFTKLRDTYVSYIIIFLIVISFNMHALFNGRVYRMITGK